MKQIQKSERELAIALTIAGSDSGGGAGIQADLKTFASLGVHGTSVITCVTAQNPKHVIGIEACKSDIILKQLQAVFEELPPSAIKTGMLYNRDIIQAVARFLRNRKRKPPLIVDPVAMATSGNQLLQPTAIKALKNELFPLAILVTPNVPEAELLTSSRIADPEQMRTAARALYHDFGCGVLLKGGHLEGYNQAMDLFYDGKTELLLCAPRFKQTLAFHGTGCTYSAAIAGYCASGCDLISAVKKAKEYITAAIAESVRICKQPQLNHFAIKPLRPS